MMDEENEDDSMFGNIDSAEDTSIDYKEYSVPNTEEEDTGEITDALTGENFAPDLSLDEDVNADDSDNNGGDGDDSPTSPESYSSDDEDEDEVQPFEKVNATDVIGAKERDADKPPKLDKKKILTIVFGFLIVFVIVFMFVLPSVLQKRKDEKKDRPVAESNDRRNYQAMATNTEKPKSEVKTEKENPKTPEREIKRDKDGIPETPKINDKYQPREKHSGPGSSMGSSSTYQIPDTRSDSLQDKRIDGIKGLSSSRRDFLASGQQVYNQGENRASTTSGGGIDGAYYPQKITGMPSREEYTSRVLSQYQQAGNSYAMQNDQSGKQKFFSQGRDGAGMGEWLPENSIWQGTILDATLTSKICTDLPGECTAVINKNIYSSQDGSLLLIPQNSKLLGSYNSSISYSQNRVQVGWHTLIRPDGYKVFLGNMNTSDAEGTSGLKGLVNDHPFAYLKAIGLMTAFNIINSEFAAEAKTTNNRYVENLYANSQEVATTLGSKLIDRAMDVQPTITIKAGKKINIVAAVDLVLPPMEPYEVTEPYRRY